MCQTNQRGGCQPSSDGGTCCGRSVLETPRSATQVRCPRAAETGARRLWRIGAARPMSWISTGVPLATCVAVWSVGDVAPTQAAWLPVLHDVVAAAASVWTALQLVVKGVQSRQARRTRFSWPTPGLLAMYAFLVLQPTLAVASSMLHGARASMFWVSLPTILPVDPILARRVDLLHGLNAVLLLCIIGWQITAAFLTLRFGRPGRTNVTR
jgi:cytochrome b561